jgi:hypothetical protein
MKSQQPACGEVARMPPVSAETDHRAAGVVVGVRSSHGRRWRTPASDHQTNEAGGDTSSTQHRPSIAWRKPL